MKRSRRCSLSNDVIISASWFLSLIATISYWHPTCWFSPTCITSNRRCLSFLVLSVETFHVGHRNCKMAALDRLGTGNTYVSFIYSNATGRAQWRAWKTKYHSVVVRSSRGLLVDNCQSLVHLFFGARSASIEAGSCHLLYSRAQAVDLDHNLSRRSCYGLSINDRPICFIVHFP